MAENTPEYGVFWGPDIYNYAAKKNYLIEHLLFEKDVVCIVADPGIGKSVLAIQLMFNLTTKEPFLDTYKVKRPCNVLYLQTEGDRSETLDRIKSMKKGLRVDDTRWVHMNLEGICLNTGDGLGKFMNLAIQPQMEYDVIIIDPLYTTVKGSMSSDEVATDWVRAVRTIKRKFNCTILVLHHDNKESYQQGQLVPRSKSSIFGSIFWAAFFNHNFKIRKHKGLHILESGKQRSGRIVDAIEMKMIEPNPLMYVHFDEGISLGQIQVEQLIKNSPIVLPAKDIITKTELSKATVFRALKKAQDRGLITKVNDKSGPGYKWTISYDDE